MNRTEAPSTPPGGPPSYSRGPPTGGDCLPVPSVGSPGSPAPSPLPTPHSEPASVPPAEPTMPTLSPQPPPSHTNTAPPLTPSQGPKSTSSACNNQVHSPAPGPTLKRPVLASRECEDIYLENEQSLPWLYDYSTQEAWLNHPVKRFKESNTSPVNVRSNTLYPPMNSQIPQSQTPKLEIKQEPNVNVVSDFCIYMSYYYLPLFYTLYLLPFDREIALEEEQIHTSLMQQVKKMVQALTDLDDKEMILLNQDLYLLAKVFKHPIKI